MIAADGDPPRIFVIYQPAMLWLSGHRSDFKPAVWVGLDVYRLRGSPIRGYGFVAASAHLVRDAPCRGFPSVVLA